VSAAQFQSAAPNPTAAFAERAIDLTFQLGSGTFTNTQSNIIKVTGLRVSASVYIPGLQMLGAAQVSVYGLPLQVMNDLSTMGNALYVVRNNQMIIEAGDVGGQMAVVFSGTIFQAFADFESAPEAVFQIQAVPGYAFKVLGASPTSYNGTVDITTILSSLCQKSGLTFQSNGVSVKLSNPYFPGTITDQIIACCEAANVNFAIQNGVLSIWSQTATPASSGLMLSAESNMVGYPTFLPQGLSVKMLFDPALQCGQTFKVQSILTPANGTWQAQILTHDLESQTFGGQWFTTIQATLPGIAFLPSGG
jgi:hypothetical protein